VAYGQHHTLIRFVELSDGFTDVGSGA
jgi:hypothetical protein